MQLRDVEIFRTVMNAGSASKAASLLGVTQSAVSQAIARLERSAGLAMFARTRGRLQALPEAHAFLIEVNKCFVGLDTLRHRLASLRRYGVERLTIACYPALGVSYLPKIIAKLARSRPSLQISLQVVSSREVREQVLSGRCDFGLMADELPLSGIDHSVLVELPAMVAMPTRHRLVKRATVSVDDYLASPVVALNPEDASRVRLVAALGDRSASFQPIVETPMSASVCELVVQGVGIGIVNPIVAISYRDRGLVLRPFEIEILFRCMLAIPASRPLSTIGREIISLLRTEIAHDLRTL
jgi:DNA-binding transcriptional LysR family regulator